MGGFERKPGGSSLVHGDARHGGNIGVGKRSLTEQLPMIPPARERSTVGGKELPSSLRVRAETSLGVGADLGDVRVHEDGVADEHGAPAVARGKDLHFGTGQYRPDNPAGQFMIAHEIGHVVQQDGGPAMTQAFGGRGGRSASLEAEANTAAYAILSGVTASITRGAATEGAPQGFDSPEHQLVGDVGSGGMTYAFGPGDKTGPSGGFELTHGDIVMLSGDYFDQHDDGKGTESSLFELAERPSSKPGTQVGTQDEVIAAIKTANRDDPRFKPGGPWAAIKISPAVQQRVDDRYRRLAMKNAEHFQKPVDGKDQYQMRESGGGTYRAMHEEALLRAYQAGRRGEDLSAAMAHEAAGQHFLTDEFSSGHMRTPRQSVQEYWNAKYPQFRTNFVQVLGRLIGEALASDRPLGGAGLPEAVLIASAQGKATEAIGAAGPPGLGDLLSLLFHDTDNEIGLQVGNDLGWEWTAYGDERIRQGERSPAAGGLSPFEIIALSVELGCDDVRRAYKLGAGEKQDVFDMSPPDRTRVLANVRQSSPAPTKPAEKYAPEQLVPRIMSSSATVNGELNWQAATFEELLGKPLRTDMPKVTVREALIAACSDDNGTIRTMMVAIAFSQDVYAKVGGITVGYPYQAFRDGVVNPLAENPLKFFYAILNNSDLRPTTRPSHRTERPL